MSFLENVSFDAVGISLEFDSLLARTGLVSLDFKSLLDSSSFDDLEVSMEFDSFAETAFVAKGMPSFWLKNCGVVGGWWPTTFYCQPQSPWD